MATLASLVDRVRMELGDPGKSFVWSATATDTNRYEMPYSPVDALTLQVFDNGTDVSLTVEVEEHTGVLTFDALPSMGNTLTAQGTYFRYFSNAELEILATAAVNEHVYNRTDAFGRALSMSTLPVIEEYPVSLLATVKALYTLATDASFDIDIQTPDGVTIPRAQRYRQLMDMIGARKEQYDDLCKALNIGLTRIETFTFRRISRATNRYVPVYVPQEIDDRTAPQRVYLPRPTYGSTPIPSDAGRFDMVFTQGDAYSFDVDFPFDLTGYTLEAQVRLYPESAAVVATPTITVTNAVGGIARVELSSAQTEKFPVQSFWDMQATPSGGEPFTYLRGTVFAERQITRG